MTYTHAWPFVLALLIAALPQGAAPGAADPEVAFTWRDLTDGRVSHTFTNSGSASEKWTATVATFAPQSQAMPALVVDPPAVGAVKPSATVTFRLRLNATGRPVPGATVRYVLAVERSGGSTTTTDRVIVQIGPVYSLAPQSPPAKFVLTATRTVPFVDPWEIHVPFVLERAADPDRVKEGVGRPLGVLYSASPAAGLDNSAVVKWSASGGAVKDRIPLQLEFPRWSSAKLSGILSLPDGQTRDVVVQTSDHVIYPLAVIVIGVMAAYKVKRYITRDRALMVLRAAIADTRARLVLADAEYREAAANAPFAGFEILPAFDRFRGEVDAGIQALQLTPGTFDQTHADFTALNTRLTQIRKLPADWLAFTASLKVLDSLRSGIADLPGLPTLTGRPAIEGSLEAAEKGLEVPSVEALTRLAAATTSLIALAQAWRAAWDRSVRLAGQAKDQAAADEINQAQRALWLLTDEQKLPEVKLLLDSATARIVKIGGTSPTAQRESAAAPEPQAELEVPERLDIERDDRLAMLVALALAVLVGLNAEYFGKPFGSLGDYARVLAWALSASIGVDLTSMALKRIGSSLAGSGVSRA